jgi:hypothetical protein
MQYLKVAWIHDFDDEPSLIYSEIDDQRYETRKIEIYKDDSFGLAGKTLEFGGTRLGLEPVPEIDEIKDDTQFVPQYITPDEFEGAWSEYLNYLSDKTN